MNKRWLHISFFSLFVILLTVNFIFKTNAGTLSKIYSFDGTSGGIPYGSLISNGGIFYGMTNTGGASDNGVIFSYDPTGDGTYTKLYDFDGTSGANPYGNLIFTGGKFYGMARSGGINGKGVIFSYEPGGAGYVKLYDFSEVTGSMPYGSLILSGGKLYGMTNAGGINGAGVIFSYDPAGPGFSKLYDFINVLGGRPYGSLVESGAGKFYGLTNIGGVNNKGVIFSYEPDGAGYSKLYDFDGTSGAYPQQTTLLLSGGKLYGMALSGANGVGVIFSYDPAGPGFSKLYDFVSSSGSAPQNSLIISGGIFYGTTYQGGTDNRGVIFSYNPTGSVFTDLYNFDKTTGENPQGSLIEGGGKFYGMTQYGGSKEKGVIFEFDPVPIVIPNVRTNDATLIRRTTVTLNGELLNTGGNDPTVGFNYGLDVGYGNTIVYGTSTRNFVVNLTGLTCGNTYHFRTYATNSAGTDYGADKTFTTSCASYVYVKLHDFNSTDGSISTSSSKNSLIEYNGKFYGMTSVGGTGGIGVIFSYELTGSGTYTKLYDFDGTNGGTPFGTLVINGGSFIV